MPRALPSSEAAECRRDAELSCSQRQALQLSLALPENQVVVRLAAETQARAPPTECHQKAAVVPRNPTLPALLQQRPLAGLPFAAGEQVQAVTSAPEPLAARMSAEQASAMPLARSKLGAAPKAGQTAERLCAPEPLA